MPSQAGTLPCNRKNNHEMLEDHRSRVLVPSQAGTLTQSGMISLSRSNNNHESILDLLRSTCKTTVAHTPDLGLWMPLTTCQMLRDVEDLTLRSKVREW